MYKLKGLKGGKNRLNSIENQAQLECHKGLMKFEGLIGELKRDWRGLISPKIKSITVIQPEKLNQMCTERTPQIYTKI